MKKILISLLTYTLALLIILNCYSIMCMVYPNWIFYILTNVNFVLLLLLRRKIKLKKNASVLCAAYLLCMLLFIVRGFFGYEFMFSCVLPFVFTVVYFDKTDVVLDFWEKYTNIIAVICLLSLVFFVFASNLHLISPTAIYSADEVGWGTNTYKDYYHLYCEGQEVYALGYSGLRNIALFVEGPMLTFVGCLALYYELFLRVKGIRKIVAASIIISIASSLSTTGLLLIVVMMYLKFYERIKNNKFLKFFCLPAIIAVLIYIEIYVIQDKFVSNVYSASVRMDDFLAALKCFVSDPINGVGYNNLKGINPFRLYKRTDAGLSTGLGGILAYGGLLWGLWYIVPVVIAVKKYISQPKYRNVLGFVFLYMALLVVTVVQSRILCTVCMTMSWIITMDSSIAKEQFVEVKERKAVGKKIRVKMM